MLKGNSRLAVEVIDVKKSFYLPHDKNDSIKSSITQVFKGKRSGGETLHALNGISFKVKKGDFFGILGRNGSGKSTLLKIISEIYQPDGGSIRHEGKLVSFIELGVGFKTELTGRENVFLNGALLGFSKKEIEDMYDEIVSFAELERFMDQKLKNYSSGMKVRLAFSVAIRAHADVLVLDEVLAVGDAAFRKKCNDYFKTLKGNKKTVILVTHSMKAVRDYCNRAIVIENGRVLFEGDAENAANEYLKLFDLQDEKLQLSSKNGKGSGRVKLDTLEVTANKSRLEFAVSLHAQDSVDGVKFGIAIKSSKGRLVTGFNSIIADGGRELAFHPGEVKKLRFVSPNILGKDKYTVVATTITLSGELLDKHDNVAEINNKPSGVFYPTVLPTEVSVVDSTKKS